MQVTINGVEYSTGRLNAKQQFHLVRRLMPALSALGEGAASLAKGLDADLSALAPLAKVLAAMPDADVNYVLDLCLSVVQRQDSGSWARVAAPNGQLMYQDITMAEMMQLVVAVVKENLSNFFRDPSAAPGAAAPQT